MNLQTTESHPAIWHGGDVWNHVDHKRLKQGEFLDFSSNVNPLGPPRKVLESISENLWRLRHYPEPNSNSIRKVIAERSPSLTWENIIVGNGASELIFLHANAVLQEGDQVLIPSPTFMEYKRAALTIGCRIKRAHYASDVPSFLTKDTKIIYLCNPNNPTGRIMPKEHMLQILDKTDKLGAYTLIDESFMDMADADKRYSVSNLIDDYKGIFVLKSFTKTFCIPGLRLGYGLGSKECIAKIMKIKPPWNVNCFVEDAAIAALEDALYLKRTEKVLLEERKYLIKNLSKIPGLEVQASDANFFLLNVQETGYTAKTLRLKLLEHNVLVRDCTNFDGLNEYYLRISIRTRVENSVLIRRLMEAVGG